VKKRATEDGAKGLRMRELAEATGLPKSTILHYIAQGLLPEPIKTSRNMAFYDPVCVERARWIKRIQGTSSLPLAKIKKLLSARDAGRDIGPLLDLHAVVFGQSTGKPVGEEEFRRGTGLTRLQVAELQQSNLLMPIERGKFAQEDIQAGRIYAWAFARGLRPRDLAFYATLGKELVDREMRLRHRLTGHLPDAQDAELTADLTRAARVLRSYVIDRAFQHRVRQAKSLKE
jgi:DNA-binding transcriptional MerR regulator